jgi:hypothetical protein
LIGKTFSRMAKFAQNRLLVRSGNPGLCRKWLICPENDEGRPDQDALQKAGADQTVGRSAEEFLVTKAHVYAPSVVVEARNVVRCIVETSQLLVTL